MRRLAVDDADVGEELGLKADVGHFHGVRPRLDVLDGEGAVDAGGGPTRGTHHEQVDTDERLAGVGVAHRTCNPALPKDRHGP